MCFDGEKISHHVIRGFPQRSRLGVWDVKDDRQRHQLSAHRHGTASHCDIATAIVAFSTCLSILPIVIAIDI